MSYERAVQEIEFMQQRLGDRRPLRPVEDKRVKGEFHITTIPATERTIGGKTDG